MNEDQINRLIKALDFLKDNMAADDTFEQIESVRLGLRKWRAQGCQGEIPYRSRLQEWGIDLETEPAESGQIVNQSGGVNVIAEGNVLIDGDVVGRDKYSVTQFILQANDQYNIEKGDHTLPKPDFVSELSRLMRTAEKAAFQDHITLLNQILGEIRALSTDFPDTRIILAAEQEVLHLRQHVRDRLGVAATKDVEHDLRSSYQIARDKAERRIPFYLDGTGEEVDPLMVFRAVRREYLAALKTKCTERLHEAKGIVDQSPNQAIEILSDCLGMLIDDVLTADDRERFSGEVLQIQHEIERIQYRLGHP